MRALASFVVLSALVACAPDAIQLAPPASPSTKTRVFAVIDGDRVRTLDAYAYPPKRSIELTDSATVALELVVLDYDRPLAELGFTRGPIARGACRALPPDPRVAHALIGRELRGFESAAELPRSLRGDILDCAPCAEDEHDAGDGTCAPRGACASGFELDGLGSCVAWRRAGELAQAVADHASVALGSGELLVIGGGFATVPATDLVQRFDPRTGTTELDAPLVRARADHRAFVLADGRVLVAGGRDVDGRGMDTIELRDANGAWRAIPGPWPARALGVGAGLLADGSVLLAGGILQPEGGAESTTDAVWRFVPDREVFEPAPPLPEPRAFATVTASGDAVAVIGGTRYGVDAPVDTVYVASSALDLWTTAHLASPRLAPKVADLGAGRLLVVATSPGSSIVDLEGPSETVLDWPAAGLVYHALAPLGPGRIVCVGGRPFAAGAGPRADVELYDDEVGWVSHPALPEGLEVHTATQLASGQVIVAGGRRGDGVTSATIWGRVGGRDR